MTDRTVPIVKPVISPPSDSMFKLDVAPVARLTTRAGSVGGGEGGGGDGPGTKPSSMTGEPTSRMVTPPIRVSAARLLAKAGDVTADVIVLGSITTDDAAAPLAIELVNLSSITTSRMVEARVEAFTDTVIASTVILGTPSDPAIASA